MKSEVLKHEVNEMLSIIDGRSIYSYDLLTTINCRIGHKRCYKPSTHSKGRIQQFVFFIHRLLVSNCYGCKYVNIIKYSCTTFMYKAHSFQSNVPYIQS